MIYHLPPPSGTRLCLGCRKGLADNRGESRAFGNKPTIVLWHQAVQEMLIERCTEAYGKSGITTVGLTYDFVRGAVDMMRAARADLLRLGFGPFGGWHQLTGVRRCRLISG